MDLPDEESFEIEFVPARLVRRRHIRRKKACRCGGYIVCAPAPARVSEGVQYGPGFHAQVVVSKGQDSMPLYRQARALRRAGADVQRSTLCDMFHRTAELLSGSAAPRLFTLVLPSIHSGGGREIATIAAMK